MRQNIPYINPATIKVNHCNQPILIATDIENDPILNFINRGEYGSQLCKAVKLSLFQDLEPSCKSWLAIRMFFPELDQCFTGNNMHNNSISHIEIFSKILDPP